MITVEVLDIYAVPRYSSRNLCQWGEYDHKHDHWAVVVTVGRGIGETTVFEEYGKFDRHHSIEWSPQHKQAERRAAELNQTSFNEHIAGRKFTRYLTFSYVSLDPDECKRHAKLDHTHPDKIRITHNVGILHYNDTWMLWDDGKITTGIGISLPYAGILTRAARSLISTVRGADGGAVNLPGGILALTKIDTVLEETAVTVGASRGHYAAERIERLRVRWLDGTESNLYAVTAGYFEGYRYDLFPTLEAARAEFGLSPSASGISEFSPDDFDYDQRLGYVSKE